MLPDGAYRGRFAPSPTGPLHFGSLVAAVASYADALAHNGTWLVRIENIDPPREMPGASDRILDTLVAHGIQFSEPLRQSDQLPAYDHFLQQLQLANKAYPCSCSRQQLQQVAKAGRAGLIYPGTCRDKPQITTARSLRYRISDANEPICFDDRAQGHLCCRIGDEIGDFLLRRGDGFVAYQAAVAFDDATQQITHVVRGTDLIDATFMQLLLFRELGYPAPSYLHIPVITDSGGHKLSKQSGATPVDNNSPEINIFDSLTKLNQKPPADLRRASLGAIWEWAAVNWDPARLRGLRTKPDRSIMMQ